MNWKRPMLYGMYVTFLSAVLLSVFYCCYAGYYAYYNKHLNDTFEGLGKDIDERFVISVMGKAYEESGCADDMFWNGEFLGKSSGICKKEFWYHGCNIKSRIWVPSCLDSWTIGFGSDGKVISKYHYSSR